MCDSKEDCQKQLTNNMSLIAITSHFAQVQFRLKQIVDSNDSDKVKLIQELEEFAFSGCEMNVKAIHLKSDYNKMITNLKAKIADLETFAYGMGYGDLPTFMILEKHTQLIKQLKKKLNLDLENIIDKDQTDLNNILEKYMQSLLKPNIVQQKLIDQLMTQVRDLEQYIRFISNEKSKFTTVTPTNHFKKDAKNVNLYSVFWSYFSSFIESIIFCTKSHSSIIDLKFNEINIHRHLLESLHLSTSKMITPIRNYMTKPTTKNERKLVRCTIKNFYISLHNILRYGLNYELKDTEYTFSLYPCKDKLQENIVTNSHFWLILLEFYRIEQGDLETIKPSFLLQEAFNIDLSVCNESSDDKIDLLCVIKKAHQGNVLLTKSMATKRLSADFHLRTFIFIALNLKKLSLWIKIIWKSRISILYGKNSFMNSNNCTLFLNTLTKFEEEMKNLTLPLNVLQKYNVNTN
ncbi:RUN domain-containing protein 1 [Intoshia linei]|uniref:RUN domain-containing protein 1 n=1 Tax=Intoshia linei TaxID=1819745 RepID=A0A177B9P6_9BILA|nr:RUN domain-containing protein 1 [Intoshia linei]